MDLEQQQDHNSNNHVTIPMETMYRNLQETQQQPWILYTPNNVMEHYETLATYTKNGYVIGVYGAYLSCTQLSQSI